MEGRERSGLGFWPDFGGWFVEALAGGGSGELWPVDFFAVCLLCSVAGSLQMALCI